MNCTSPLKRWVIGYDHTRDQDIAKVTSFKTEHVLDLGGHVVDKYQEIPCGKCLACRLNYSESWAIRIMLESKKYEHNEVLTLTYDPEHLPKVQGINRITGEQGEVCTLKPEDVQKFLKRLRKAFAAGKWGKHEFEPNDKLRFFNAGEYGEQNGRAHYHIVVFNLDVYDKEPTATSKRGNEQWTSKLIEEIWGMGRITLMPLNYETAAYVARYIVKKQKGPGSKELYELSGQHPEYTTMSRMPGIASEYYNEKKGELYETQKIWLQTQKKIRKVKLPRYFDKRFEIDEPEEMKRIKKQRKELNEMRTNTILSRTDKTREEYLKVQEENLKARTKNLIRTLEGGD
ncbi:replication initiator protein [Dipodfec virus UOA04_Rod_907]|nr:replication initiator protein [Dipodfec virus UOA04_Rod_907]